MPHPYARLHRHHPDRHKSSRPVGIQQPDFSGYRRTLEGYDIKYLNEMLAQLGRMRARTKADAVHMIITNMEREAVHMRMAAARNEAPDHEPYQGSLH